MMAGADGSPGNHPPRVVLILFFQCAYVLYRGLAERADLLRPVSPSFGQEIDNTSLAHVALHPRCPRVTARTVDAQANAQQVKSAAQLPQCLEQVWALG
jgi:hypothetical protein